jgi:o-succinylbenzoate synthase
VKVSRYRGLVRIDEVELRLISVPLRTPFQTSFGVERAKVAIIVTVRSGGVEGYGETVMEQLPLYREETVIGGLHLLRQALAPDVLANPVSHPENLATRWAKWRGNPMAKAGLELAIWDCFARQEGVSLSKLLGGTREHVAVGASLGIAQRESTLESVTQHVAEGYQRIKLKIEPGWDRQILSPVRELHPDIHLTADANAAYTLADTPLLQSLDEYGLHYLEQPLGFDDLTHHAQLAKQLRTLICLDESLNSPARVSEALTLGACAVVNVKVGRVGGIRAVREIHELCFAADTPMWCGGMLETGVGRAHNIHLASLPGFGLPGDTASASRTYSQDIVEQPLEAENGWMAVPTGPGIGVTLNQGFLGEVTQSVEVIRR